MPCGAGDCSGRRVIGLECFNRTECLVCLDGFEWGEFLFPLVNIGLEKF